MWITRKGCVLLVRANSVGSAKAASTSPVGDKPNVDFGDPEIATRGKTTWEVFRGWLVFKIFTYDAIVDNSIKVSSSIACHHC